MDTSGNNRYELLFMDDDSGATSTTSHQTVPEPPETATKKKAPATAAPKKPQATTKKPNPNSEKENKSNALNKSEAGKKPVTIGQTSRPGAVAGAGYRNRTNGPATSDGGERGGPRHRGSQNAEGREVRDQHENRRREGGFGNAAGSEYNNEQRQPRQFKDRDNRGPPRNRFGEGGGFRGGKREFDRQSGSDKTGVKAVDKRDGAGAHNWGSVKQDIEDVNKSSNDVEVTLTEKDESAIEQTTEPIAAPEEEETKEFTLDEWKAMRQQRAKPQFNLRKAGEGEDTSQWKKMVVLNKKKEGDSEEEFEYDPSLYPQRVGRLQRIVDIQFKFNDGRRGGGGFGRGRGRGPRPGGGAESTYGDRAGRFEGGSQREQRDGALTGEPAARVYQPGRDRNFAERQQRSGPNALMVDDERQFPTLS